MSTDSIQPTPERYAGQNFPYRGTETHGVDPGAMAEPVPGFEYGTAVAYEKFEPPQDPIPVTVVQSGPSEYRDCRPYSDYAAGSGSAPNRIVAPDDTRIGGRLRNMNSTTVYIGSTQETANSVMGWPLVQNAELPFVTQRSLYALSADANPQKVNIIVEYARER